MIEGGRYDVPRAVQIALRKIDVALPCTVARFVGARVGARAYSASASLNRWSSRYVRARVLEATIEAGGSRSREEMELLYTYGSIGDEIL
jgi:hypothetical protein